MQNLASSLSETTQRILRCLDEAVAKTLSLTVGLKTQKTQASRKSSTASAGDEEETDGFEGDGLSTWDPTPLDNVRLVISLRSPLC